MDNNLETKENESKENKKRRLGIEEDTFNNFFYAMFFYFLIGVVIGYGSNIGFLSEISELIMMGYLLTLGLAVLIYYIISSFGECHKSFLMNIIDAIVGFFAIRLSYSTQFQSFISLIVGGGYSFIPLLFLYIDKKDFDIIVIFKTLTRILMLLLIIFMVLLLDSCGAGIDG